MFIDKEVRAIFTVKGGDMVNGILPYIDFENIKNNPKIFLGMSDISVLLGIRLFFLMKKDNLLILEMKK